MGHLAPALVGHADDRDAGHPLEAADRLLDLDRVDVLAARDDHVLDAIDDRHEAVASTHADVAGRSQPSAVKAASVASSSPQYSRKTLGPRVWISPGSPARSRRPASSRRRTSVKKCGGPEEPPARARGAASRRGHARGGLGHPVPAREVRGRVPRTPRAPGPAPGCPRRSGSEATTGRSLPRPDAPP